MVDVPMVGFFLSLNNSLPSDRTAHLDARGGETGKMAPNPTGMNAPDWVEYPPSLFGKRRGSNPKEVREIQK
jgi:hypothetical protein